MRDEQGNNHASGKPRGRKDVIGLALVGLVIALSLVIAAAVALPAWADINADPGPGMTAAQGETQVAGQPGTGPTTPPPVRTRPATAASEPPQSTVTGTPADEPTAGPTLTPTPEIDATLRPAPPNLPDDGSGLSTVIQSGPADRQEIALTFDAGDDRGRAEDILDLLKDRGLVASFGVTGRWADANPDLIERMVNEGHMLINHTFSHQSFTGESTGTGDPGSGFRIDELQRTEQVVEDIAGYDLRPFFRPPYGDLGQQTLTDVATAGYGVTVMWTVDSLGWQEGATPDEVVTRVLDGAAPGGILLFHVSTDFADYDALPEILDGLAEDDYALVTVEQLLRP